MYETVMEEILNKAKEDNYTFFSATKEDAEEILRLYKGVIGSPFCFWTDEYPGMEEIEFDLKRDCLFGVRNADGEIVAVITIDADDEITNLPCWSSDLGKKGELSRLGVRIDQHNKGLAKKIFAYGLKMLRDRGYDALIYLVAQGNVKAQKSYSVFGATKVGEKMHFGDMYDCCELRLH